MIFMGPFQPEMFYDSRILGLYVTNLGLGSNI